MDLPITNFQKQEEFLMAGGRVFRRIVKGVQQKTWTVQYDAPPDKMGKRKQKMKGGFKTKAEAQAFLSTKQHEVNTGTYIEPSKMTLAQYIDFWLDTYVRHNVQDTTLYSYTEKLRHVKSEIGHYHLKDLSAAIIQEYIKSRLDSGLSAGTIIEVIKKLKACLKQATESELIAKNPADKVKPPKKITSPVQATEPDRIKLLIDTAKMTKDYEIVYMYLTTGLRRGELLGLRWQDVDLKSGNIRVVQSVHRVTGIGIVIHGNSKSVSSHRTIAISPETVQMLKKHKIKQAERKLAAGSGYADKDLVFANRFGGPIDPDKIQKRFKKIAQQAGLGHLNIRMMRHLHASFLLAQGESVKLVQERLGHKDASITLNVYSHLLPNTQKQAAEKLDGFLGLVESNG